MAVTLNRRQDVADNLANRAVTDLLRLIDTVRTRDQGRVDEVLAELDLQRLYGVATAAACMIPADVDVTRALAWINDEPGDWPDDVVIAEAARFRAGDRDRTAWMAAREAGIRQARNVAATLRPVHTATA